MSKFIIACPVCHHYAEASTGFFSNKNIRCGCGNMIHVRTDRMAAKTCPGCGNNVMYDQAVGTNAVCPVCKSALVSEKDYISIVRFRCDTCGCLLQADKNESRMICPVCDASIDVQKAIGLMRVRDAGVPAIISGEADGKTLVWKHPMTDFVTGSQLIVHEGQAAVFFLNGRAQDVFGAGRHMLETGTLPKLGDRQVLPENEPFHAEVYFVNLTTQLGIKWGTPSKVSLFDPATGMHVELGASGTFNLRVTDPTLLLNRLVGTGDVLRQDDVFNANGAGDFRSLIVTKVKSRLARVIKENRISVLEIDEHLDTISAALRDAINGELTEYGLEMPEFYVGNIQLPEDDPDFRRAKRQHAELYLGTREEQIQKQIAEDTFERKAVEAQTKARLGVIEAQGDADILRIRAQAEADALRMRAEAEAAEMKMKGYSYQDVTARQVSFENAKHGVNPDDAVRRDAWDCSCGRRGITSRFCPECGGRKPEQPKPWNCACGQTDIIGKFCPNCGSRKPENWDCPCGRKNISSKFCPECGKKREE